MYPPLSPDLAAPSPADKSVSFDIGVIDGNDGSAVTYNDRRIIDNIIRGINGLNIFVVPFFIFIMPRIVASLHPDPIVNAQGKTHMNAAMLVVFLCSLAGFTVLYFWMMAIRVRAARLESSEESEGN